MKKENSNYYSNTRPEVVSFVPSNTKTILDIGCGLGGFLNFIKEEIGAETWGIEIVDKIAEKAKVTTDKILIGKVEDLLSQIPDDYFDCICFNDVLEHLLEPSEILIKIKPKLSEEGIIIASIPNVRYFFNIYELIIKKDWEYKETGILDKTHFRFFTKNSMKRMIVNSCYE